MAEQVILTSHSIDGTFENCPRKFEFLHLYLKKPELESDAYAADVGTAEHEAVQAWQRAEFILSRNPDVFANAEFNGSPIERLMYESPEDYGLWHLLLNWPWELEDQGRITGKPVIGQRTLGNGILMYDETIRNSIWNNWELVEIDQFGPAIEVPFRIIHKSLGKVRLPGGKEAYIATQGKIDNILRHKKTGEIRILDFKTTEKKEPAHDAAFRFSGQGSQYGIVLSHAIGLDWQNKGLAMTYLIMHFSPDGAKVYPLSYELSPEEVQDMIDAKVDRLLRMREYALRRHWPRRQHGCENFGQPCGFLDICHRRDEDFILEWFKFEESSGRFSKYTREYDPVWILES